MPVRKKIGYQYLSFISNCLGDVASHRKGQANGRDGVASHLSGRVCYIRVSYKEVPLYWKNINLPNECSHATVLTVTSECTSSHRKAANMFDSLLDDGERGQDMQSVMQ